MRLRYLEIHIPNFMLGKSVNGLQDQFGTKMRQALKFGYSTCEWHNNFTEYQ